MVLLINAGIFDTIPHSRYFYTQSLGTQHISTMVTESRWVKTFSETDGLIAGISLENTGQNNDLEMGVLWGDDEQRLEILLTPQGIVSVTGINAGKKQVLLLPQPWVHAGTTTNEFLVLEHNESDPSTTIWLNREILWHGKYPSQTPQIGWFMHNHTHESHVRIDLKWHLITD